MNPRRLALALASSAILLPLIACGASSSLVTTPTSANTNLSGNWLLDGSLPISNAFGLFPIFGTNAPTSGLAADVDIIGSNVTANVSVMYTCATSLGVNTTITTGGFVTGPIASDGTFVLTAPSNDALNLTLHGKVPSSARSSWSGDYSYSIATTYTPCTSVVSRTGTIAAVSMPLINGTYHGSQSTLGGSPPQISVTTTLKQSGTLATTTGSSYTSNIPLSGSVTITGSSCLTSGTPATTSPSPTFIFPSGVYSGTVEGNTVIALYQMNDNSLVALEGSINSTDSTKILARLVTLQPGTCNSSFNSGALTLTRQ